MQSDNFWIDNIDILFRKDKLLQVFPNKDMTLNEKLNSISKLAIYVFIFFFLFSGTDSFLLLPVLTIIALIFIQRKFGKKEGFKTRIKSAIDTVNEPVKRYQEIIDNNIRTKDELWNEYYEMANDDSQNTTKVSDEDLKKGCTSPTKDNPFMNPLEFDPPNKPPPCHCDGDNKDVKDSFYENLFLDFDNLYEKHNSLRQYHTVPVSSFPSNQTEFAKWIAGVDNTCKMYGDNCSAGWM